MKTIIFKLTVWLITAVMALIPDAGHLCVDYRLLPIELSIEQISDIYIPADNNSNVSEYPTVIKLCHQPNEADNGKLLASFEKWGSTYPVYISSDDAKSWDYICTVKDSLNEGYWNEWMPFLFELPDDIGNFEKGTIILAGTSVFGEGVTDSTVTLYSSTDLGKSFNAFCNVDKAGGTEWDVWEPYLIYEESSERIYCFYSDDSDPEHSQKLVYKYSTDLVNWSDKYECVACDDPNLRPGMPSLTKMGNGEYYLVYEMVGISGNPIYRKKTKSLDDWGDVSDYGEIVSACGKTFGSSPWTVWSPVGGERGTLIVTAKHMINGKSNSGTDFFISFDYGETFVPIENPLPYTLDNHERCGYSPAFFLSPDGATVYYLNNPPCYESTYKISCAKIKLG